MSPALLKLREAVEEFVREEWGTDPALVLADWIMVTFRTGWNEDDEPVDSYGTIFCNGDMADHQAVGLLRLIADRIQYGYNESTILNPGRGPEDEE